MVFSRSKSIFIFFLLALIVLSTSSVYAYTGFLPKDADAITSEYTSMVKEFSFRKSLMDIEGNSVSNLTSIYSLSTEEAELYSTLTVSYYKEDDIKNALRCSMHFTYNPELMASKEYMATFIYPFFNILFGSKGYSKSNVDYMVNFLTTSYEASLVDSSWKIYDSIGDILILFSFDNSGTLPILKCEIYKDSYVPKASMNLNSLAVLYNHYNLASDVTRALGNGSANHSFTTSRTGFFLYFESVKPEAEEEETDMVSVKLYNSSLELIYSGVTSLKNIVYVNVPPGTYTVDISGKNWLFNIGQ